MQPNKPFLQYVAVKLTNGDHEFSYNTFLPCADKSGLSDSEILEFLQDTHNVRDEPTSNGLKDGYYWTNSDTAAGVFPEARNDSSDPEKSVYRSNSELIKILKVSAPEILVS